MPLQNSFHQPDFRFQALWIGAGFTLVIIVIYLSLAPGSVPSTGSQGDKLMHVMAYALPMSWFANLWPQTATRIKIAIGLIALGIALEFVQRWTGYRTFEVADMLADGIGVMAGWLLSPPRMPNYLHAMELLLPR